MSFLSRTTGLAPGQQGPVVMAGLGHGAIHWTAAVFYLLLPFIANTFSWSYTEAGLLVSMFHAVTFVANIVSGPVVDIWQRKTLVQAATVGISAVALAAFAFADGLAALAFLVAVIAVANNFWHPAAISLLSERYPESRGYALSVHALGANAGDALAPLLAGMVLLTVGWQMTAALTAGPVLLVAILLTLVPLLARRRARGKANVTAAKTRDFASYLIGLKALLRNRGILLLCFMAGTRTMTQTGLLTFLPLYLAQATGGAALQMGLSISAMQGAGVVAAPVSGILSDRFGRRGLVIAGLALGALFTAILPSLSMGLAFIAGAICLGLAIFSVRPVIHSWLMDLSPPHMAGSAASLVFGVQGGLSVITPIIGGWIADHWGWSWVFIFLAAAMAISCAAAFVVPTSATDKAAMAD